MRIGIGASKKTIIGKKKDADKSGIGIGITGIVRSSSIVGMKISSFLLSETSRNVMVMIGMTDQIGSMRTITAGLMGRLGGERRFMIGWEAGSACMIGLVTVLNTFPGTRKSLKKWLMHGSRWVHILQGCQYLSDGVKGKSSPIGKTATTSSMVSRGVD